MAIAALIVGCLALCVGGYACWELRWHKLEYSDRCWDDLSWHLRIEANEDEIEDLKEFTCFHENIEQAITEEESAIEAKAKSNQEPS